MSYSTILVVWGLTGLWFVGGKAWHLCISEEPPHRNPEHPFTKWVAIFALSDQIAITCTEVILNEVTARFVCPLSLHSDQGKNYESKIFTELCRLLEISMTRTSPGNPRCNGKEECFNPTLLKMINAYLKEKQRNWDKHLGCLAAAYQGTIHKRTGLTPNLVMLGREKQMPAEVIFGCHSHDPNETYGEHVHKLKETMQHAHGVARTHCTIQPRGRNKLMIPRWRQTNMMFGTWCGWKLLLDSCI